MVKRFFIFVLPLVLALASCYIDVPHDSRYDNLNPFGKASLSIYVKDKHGNPNQGALIILNDTLEFETDAEGEFYLGTVAKGVLRIRIHADGYRTFEMETTANTGEVLDIIATLNFIPVIEEFKAYSSVRKIKSFTDTLDYDVNYTGIIREMDGIEDIDSCVMTMDSVRFKMEVFELDSFAACSLNFPEDNGFFQIYDLQGKKCRMDVYDKSGEIIKSGEANLVRFVESIPEITAPEEGGSFTLPDSVKWTFEEVLFESYFNLEIFNGEEQAYESNNIPSTKRSAYIGELLNEGSYRLYLRAYDVYGNFSENSVTFSIF
ncbi:MAG: carboxypeptidase-like regulatory domain-containing protein [bacterium]|nr:carboxypeptidase-like regulatory domain-containing protein [bacterium]